MFWTQPVFRAKTAWRSVDQRGPPADLQARKTLILDNFLEVLEVLEVFPVGRSIRERYTYLSGRQTAWKDIYMRFLCV